MSINSVSFSAPICCCDYSDYEQIQIERLLKVYGIEPSGNKAADKAKLHEIELQKAKAQNEPSGKFLTISYGKEQEIIKNKRERLYGSLKNYKKEKGNNDEPLRADEILGRQIMAVIELKKREEKDYKKSKELRVNSLKSNHKKTKAPYESSIVVNKKKVLPELNSETEIKTKNNIEN